MLCGFLAAPQVRRLRCRNVPTRTLWIQGFELAARSRNCLELGAGVGLCGLLFAQLSSGQVDQASAACCACAAAVQVVLTDHMPEVLALLKKNAELVPGSCETAQSWSLESSRSCAESSVRRPLICGYNWGDPPPVDRWFRPMLLLGCGR